MEDDRKSMPLETPLDETPGREGPSEAPTAAAPLSGAVDENAEAPRPESTVPVAAPPAERVVPRTRRIGMGRLVSVALIAGVVAGVLAGGSVYLGMRQSLAGLVAKQQVSASKAAEGPAETTEQSLEAAAAGVLPAVVNVAVDTPVGSGVGSGIILRSDGYILTNNHVASGATRITVRLGTTDYPASIVGTDPTSDLAVIKVAKTGLPVATLGSSATLQVGESVIAVGSPFGLDKTVTSGIVSALHRSNLQSGIGVAAYTDLIQTDAPINPGNSGGALADDTGQVVGINTLIETPTGQLGASQSAGIGFAIPMDYAKTIADQIIAGQKVTHPFLGVSAVTVTPGFAKQFGLSVTSGALVQQVVAGSPAATGGIKVGDIIVQMGTTQIMSSDDMFAAVRNATVGKPIAIQVVRNGKTLTLQVTLVAQ